MKGAIFIALNEMVEQQYGIDAWESILSEVNPTSEGIYTSTEDYADEEINEFVRVISLTLSLPSSEITRGFGTYLFGELNQKHDIFTKLSPNLFHFLHSIENIIHKEVRKLYENTSLPKISCETINSKELRLHYTSPRKLCFLAEGLIFGAAEYYEEQISIHHDTCLHRGDDACLLRVVKDETSKV